MTALLESLRDLIDSRCCVKRMRKVNCKVGMTDVPARKLIVDFDRPGSPLSANETRCDYLLVAEDEQADNWVAVLELKRGELRASQVVGQLQAGASAAERLVPPGQPFKFRPVVAYGGSTSKDERRKLKEEANVIGLHGRRERVRLMKCGDSLARVL